MQRATGKFLCCALAIGSTMLHALSSIAGAASKGTEEAEKAAQRFMGYAHYNPGAEMRFRASDMAKRES